MKDKNSDTSLVKNGLNLGLHELPPSQVEHHSLHEFQCLFTTSVITSLFTVKFYTNINLILL